MGDNRLAKKNAKRDSKLRLKLTELTSARGLLWQANAANKLLEARIGTQTVEPRVKPERPQQMSSLGFE